MRIHYIVRPMNGYNLGFNFSKSHSGCRNARQIERVFASALDVDPAYIRRILDLANLSPAMIERILDGDEPDGLSLSRLRKGFPEVWCEQEAALEG